MRWMADAPISEVVEGEWIPPPPTLLDRQASRTRISLLLHSTNAPTSLEETADFQTVTAISPRLRISASLHRWRGAWPVGQCGDMVGHSGNVGYGGGGWR